jgi:hypothetical protein
MQLSAWRISDSRQGWQLREEDHTLRFHNLDFYAYCIGVQFTARMVVMNWLRGDGRYRQMMLSVSVGLSAAFHSVHTWVEGGILGDCCDDMMAS